MLVIWTDLISTLEVPLTRRLRRFALEKIESFAPLRQNCLSNLAVKLIRINSFFGTRESKYFNLILTRLLPANPLFSGRKHFPTILICAHKDLEILPFSLVSAVENLSGGEKLWILIPEAITSEVQLVLIQLEIDAGIITDEELLASFFRDSKVDIKKAARMQLLKLLAVLSLNYDEIMVADGDTLYIKSRNWRKDKKIVYPVSQEYLIRHKNFNQHWLALSPRSGLGFVTHHQIIVKKCLEEIVLRAGGILALSQIMQTVFANTDNWHIEYPSEWQFLGDFTSEHRDYELVPARFANLAISRNSLRLNIGIVSSATDVKSELDKIAELVPEIYSISLHAYK